MPAHEPNPDPETPDPVMPDPETPDSETEDRRLQRERSFHDHKYADDAPPPTLKYYETAGRCFADYRNLLSGSNPGSRVLEYGCGEGSAAYDLAAAGIQVTAIDISEVAIEHAQAEAHRLGVTIDFRAMDAEHLQFPAASFDRICGSGILHHLDVDRGTTEIARCLAPDGDAVFVEPLGHNPLINAYRRLTPDLRTADEHPLRTSDLETLRLHFDDVDVRYYALTTIAATPIRSWAKFPQIIDRLERFDDTIFRHWPALQRFAWYSLIVLRRPRA